MSPRDEAPAEDVIPAWQEARHGNLSVASESEQALIGATFRDNSLAVTLELSPDEFGLVDCRALWQMAQTVVQRGDAFTVGAIVKQAPDLAPVVRYCVDMGAIGGWHAGTVEGYVRAIKDANARRRIEDLCRGLAEQVWDQSFSTEQLLTDFANQTMLFASKSKAITKRALAERIAGELGRPVVCYSTGFPVLDKCLAGGLWPGKTYGFAARKKVGKTVLLGSISHNLNAAQVPHLDILLEMSDGEIEQRNAARDLGINSIEFLTRRDPDLANKMASYAHTVPDSTVFVHRPGASVEDIFRVIRKAIVTHKIKGVIIDYWQLIQGKQRGESEEYHLRSVAQAIADFCRIHGLWCVITAQVNQDGNTRGGEGLKLACDVYFTLHREKDHEWAWLEMEESRYVPYRHVGEGDKDGKAVSPGLIMVSKGPYFIDASLWRVDTPMPGSDELPL